MILTNQRNDPLYILKILPLSPACDHEVIWPGDTVWQMSRKRCSQSPRMPYKSNSSDWSRFGLLYSCQHCQICHKIDFSLSWSKWGECLVTGGAVRSTVQYGTKYFIIRVLKHWKVLHFFYFTICRQIPLHFRSSSST